MNTRVIVLLAAIGLSMSAVAFVPEASAHNCSGWIPTDCGPCTTGTHSHTYCSSNGELDALLQLQTDLA